MDEERDKYTEKHFIEMMNLQCWIFCKTVEGFGIWLFCIAKRRLGAYRPFN